METLISSTEKGERAHSRFPLMFFRRYANQLPNQGEIVQLYNAPDRYSCLRIINEEKAVLSSLCLVDSGISSEVEYYCPTTFSKTVNEYNKSTVHTVTQFSPSPVISCVENVSQDNHISRIEVGNPEHGHSESCKEASSSSKSLQDVHIPARLMEDFLDLAKENTEKDLETCGILGAFLKKETLYVTTLIIPKQESTSSSCQAINYEEFFIIQKERSLLPVGWIHTHPSQSCFLSSVDLHTQYSYQVMIPEAFAIVMAPTDTSRSYGIFRLSEPGGMGILRECQENGFHPHKETADGSPIYGHCSNVYKNSNLRLAYQQV
ncbi:hypothetical protein FNV43_RR26005 [Rhamnella rubrinervis]|uniref:MPN domain-containing protein n=1 Tax=Rhamnella rubrinervis TaxID=2594499 RepID=A0A8K0GR28_9ROSA|nr:hypothetical protein FNV43_RR26005 [Rhamnella rubrinervis]